MKIRKAKKDDIGAICELGYKLLKCHCQFRKYYTPISNSKKRKKIQKKYFSDQLNKRNSLFLVLEDNGKVVGYSIAKIEKDPPILAEPKKGNFAEIYIDTGCRGRGGGRQLLKQTMKWFKRRKIKRVIVDYDAKNLEGEKFYKR
ncbi:GNAT family N-acetyltransferase, partial [Candidatus Micrarchaeota archaeon]|nr:GNAT family N-acetyltransferase [Candidatus Micrarchaeota archaeon]